MLVKFLRCFGDVCKNVHALMLRKSYSGCDTVKTDLLPNKIFHDIANGFDRSKQSFKLYLNACTFNLSTIKEKGLFSFLYLNNVRERIHCPKRSICLSLPVFVHNRQVL